MGKQLSKKAKEYLERDSKISLEFYSEELKKTCKNKNLPLLNKIILKSILSDKIKMCKEILEFIK